MADGEMKHGEESTGYQFGTFKGVFTPSILTILGVIMYMRFGWAIGSVGLFSALVIITIASSITFLTGLSLSALATNMKVEGGGAYYIISRSLGIEAGAAVGVPLFFAQALGISFYVAGFSESLVTAFPQLVPKLARILGFSGGYLELAHQYDMQVVGVLTLLLLTAVAYKSADLALKSQFGIMAIILVSLLSLFMGSDPTPGELAKCSEQGLRAGSFWVVFAVIFPAVTGIEAGIAMSGDLKDSAKSLPRGTVGAVLVGYVAYVSIISFIGITVHDHSVLLEHPLVMVHVAKWGNAILLGIWAASLSSAMGALLGAPRTLQALARDRVIPSIFGRGFGKGNDPRVATATAFVVGLVGILAGDLNVIAPVLSMFFLTSYGLLNVSAGLEELTSPPSWRPKFRIPWLLSVIGACGCFAAMFMIHAGATFIAAFVAFSIYFLMERRSLKAWWGDMRSGILMLIARNTMHALARRKPDERTWKPNILVLSGSPTSRWYLIELAHAISQGRGFTTVAAIVPPETTMERIENLSRTVEDYLERRGIAAFVKVCQADSPLEGARILAKTYGYGPISPNTILLGETEKPEHYESYAQLVRLTNQCGQNLVVVRESDGEEEYRKKERIDLWWYGTQQNLGLMLALAYLLKRSPVWRRASLVLKSIVDKEDDVADTKKRLETFIEDVRLDASAEVLIKHENDVFTTIKANSQGADLVCLGMRAPGKDESTSEYCAYYKDLLAKTDGLPPTALILAAEDVDFYGIFGGA